MAAYRALPENCALARLLKPRAWNPNVCLPPTNDMDNQRSLVGGKPSIATEQDELSARTGLGELRFHRLPVLDRQAADDLRNAAALTGFGQIKRPINCRSHRSHRYHERTAETNIRFPPVADIRRVPWAWFEELAFRSVRPQCSHMSPKYWCAAQRENASAAWFRSTRAEPGGY